jgi:hypothetical protein
MDSCYCPSSNPRGCLVRARALPYRMLVTPHTIYIQSLHGRLTDPTATNSSLRDTQVNTRTHTQSEIRSARRLAPLATPHTIYIETHRSLRDYAFPRT